MQAPKVPALTHRDSKPEPFTCETCETEVGWHWWEGIPGRLRPRWVVDEHTCRLGASVRRHRHDLAMRKANIPSSQRDLSYGKQTRMANHDTEETFIKRVRGGGTVGVSDFQMRATDMLDKWSGSNSLYLWGPVGTGKTTLVVARINDLLAPEVGTLEGPLLGVCCPGTLTVHAKPGLRGLLYIGEEELDMRIDASWSGDKDPLKQVAEIPVLVLDDWGSIEGGRMEKQRRQLIAYRYRHNLPTVLTANSDIEDVAGIDARTASRMREMMSGRVIELSGRDWRTV